MRKSLPCVSLALLIAASCTSSSSPPASTDGSARDQSVDAPLDAPVSDADTGTDATTDTGASDASEAATNDAPAAADAEGGAGATCEAGSTGSYVSYVVKNTGFANVPTSTFSASAAWGPGGGSSTAWWEVIASGSACTFAPNAEIRLGGDIVTSDGGVAVPATAMTWSVANDPTPTSPSDATILLVEYDGQMMGTGWYWSSGGAVSGTITGSVVNASCYELQLGNVFMMPDANASGLSDAKGYFSISGMARVGRGCP